MPIHPPRCCNYCETISQKSKLNSAANGRICDVLEGEIVKYFFRAINMTMRPEHPERESDIKNKGLCGSGGDNDDEPGGDFENAPGRPDSTVG